MTVSSAADEEDGDEGGERAPSKSARKRAAHAAQDLGEALIGLRDAQLSTLNLPEMLLDAIRAARSIKSRAGLARQRQFIGKLMRSVDPEPIKALLAAQSERDAAETERFKRLENWRERLISEGEPALAELQRWHPQLELDAWQARLNAARAERAHTGTAGPASRELFRALRALFATMPR
jgi:ribosome-associated protein